MKRKSDFVVFPKRLASGTTLYYYYVYDESGNRKQFSTGQKNEIDAYKYCIELLKNGKLLPVKFKDFNEFCKEWFVYDKCQYIKSRLNRGFSFSRSTAKNKRNTLTKYILPVFGNKAMDLITTNEIEFWLLDLKKKGLSNSTVNSYLSTFKQILNEAYRTGVINQNPGNKISPFKVVTKDKGILTDIEYYKLFSKVNLDKVWESETFRTICLLASKTGMRIGEIRALKCENIYKDHIVVKHSFERGYELKSTKSGKLRKVPITEDIHSTLQEFMNPENEYLFMGSKGKPISYFLITNKFYKALENIGIDKTQRKSRNITFHSWRHYFNSKLRISGVPDAIIRAVIGHSSIQMTENYTNIQLEDCISINKTQKRLEEAI